MRLIIILTVLFLTGNSNGHVILKGDELTNRLIPIEAKIKLINERKSNECFNKKNMSFPKNGATFTLQQDNATITDILKNGNIIRLGYSGIETITIEFPDKTKKQIDYNVLTYIINLDVVKYYGLIDTYDSELKRKVFSQTSEYKSKYYELKTIKEYIIGSYFCLSVKMDCFYKYDLNQKAFRFRVTTLNGFFYSKKFLQYDNLCILKPANFKYNNGVIFGGTDYFVEQNYFVPVNQESIALNIEENCESVELMFILKLSSIESAKNALGYNSDYLVSLAKQVLLYNKNTGEIFVRFKY